MKIVKIITEREFNKLVSDTYKRPYYFQQQDGCKDRGIVKLTVPCEEFDYPNTKLTEKTNGEKMGISFKTWLERDVNMSFGKIKKEGDIDLFWSRNFYPHVSLILNDLHRRGLLDAGELLIDIDW